MIQAPVERQKGNPLGLRGAAVNLHNHPFERP